MKDGRIVENGSHDDLMAKKSDYYVMVTSTEKSSNRAEEKQWVHPLLSGSLRAAMRNLSVRLFSRSNDKAHSNPPSENVSAVPSKERIIDGMKGKRYNRCPYRGL